MAKLALHRDDWPASCNVSLRSETMARKRNDVESPAADTGEAGYEERGPRTGGQSGDTQGLSDLANADSESVEELAEEGQYFEAGIVSGIENAPDADAGEVTTREVPEDDVPVEYQGPDQD
jgi:hypothetical protein